MNIKSLNTIWILFFLVFFCGEIHAQENPRTINPLGISAYGGGPPLFASLSLDYFVDPRLSLDVGGGFFGVYGGGRYHLKGDNPDKEWTFYTGLLYGRYGEAVGVDQMLFLPLGFHYIGEKQFNFTIEMLVLGEFGAYIIPVWPGIKFGYRFKL